MFPQNAVNSMTAPSYYMQNWHMQLLTLLSR